MFMTLVYIFLIYVVARTILAYIRGAKYRKADRDKHR